MKCWACGKKFEGKKDTLCPSCYVKDKRIQDGLKEVADLKASMKLEGFSDVDIENHIESVNYFNANYIKENKK